MKKLFLLMTCIAFIITGCGGGASTAPEENTNVDATTENAENSSEQTPSGYYLKYNDVIIAINVEAAPIISSLPKENSYFEAESCAFQGLDKIYTYNGFELHTYEIEGVDHVYGMIFLDDTIETVEGIRLFSTLDEVLAVYGDNFEESMGLYTYKKDGTILSFLIENNEVVSIEYNAIIE